MSDNKQPRDRDPRSVSEIRRGSARQTVRNILTQGILPDQEQRAGGGKTLRSNATDPSLVHGLFVYPSSQDFVEDTATGLKIATVNGYQHHEIIPDGQSNQYEYLLNMSLYGIGRFPADPYALYHVLVEREDMELTDLTRRVIEDRTQNSIVVATPAGNIPSENFVPQAIVREKGIIRHSDVRVRGRVPVSIVFIPEALSGDFGDILEGFRGEVVLVPNKQLPALQRRYPQDLLVPDYKTALLAAVEESGPLFIHGVRLPTNEDIVEGRAG